MIRNDEAYRAIEMEMSEIRTSIQSDVNDAVHRAKEFTDWRTHVRRHPWITLGTATALGFVVARKSLGTGISQGAATTGDEGAPRSDAALSASTSTPTTSVWHDVARWAVGFAVRNAVQWATLQAAQRFSSLTDAGPPATDPQRRRSDPRDNKASVGSPRWRKRRDYPSNGGHR